MKKKMKRLIIPTSKTAECLYVPEAVDIKEVLVSKKYRKMADISVADYNMKKNTNLEFVEIDKADREKNVCSGHFYDLSIKVKDKDDGEVKIINKMVWKGSSRSLLSERVVVNQIPTTTTTLLPVSDARTKKLIILADDELDTSEYAIDIVVHTEFLGDVPKGAHGYINFTKYHLYFTPLEKKDQEQGGIVCISILHRKWLYTLDNTVAASLREQRLRPQDLFGKHPLVVPEPPPSKRKKVISKDHILVSSSTFKLLELDLISPMIFSCAIDDYNFKEGAQLQFMNVLKAQLTNCAGVSFNLTLQAKDQEVVKIFNTRVWSRPWLKFVNISPPLTEVVAPAPKRARKFLHDVHVGRVTRSSTFFVNK